MSDEQTLEGEFGNGQYFSDLFVKCIELEFSGGVLIWSESSDNEGRFFFFKGRPFLCSGDLFTKHQLGTILQRLGMASEDDIDLALRAQGLQEEEEHELLGELLKREAFVPDTAIEAALQIQTKKRLMDSFAIDKGMWRALWSKSPNIVKRGAVIEPWDVLIPAIQGNASDTELRDFSDELLGSAVKLLCPIEALESYGVTEEHTEILNLIQKPRRPDQIEKSIGRRETRALLKALSLAGLLERVSAKKGIPLTTPRPKSKAPETPPAVERTKTPAPREISAPKPRQTSRVTKYDDATLRIIESIDSTFLTLEKSNYFEILGANPHSNSRELRAKYTDLVRQFHPDTLRSKKLDDERMSKAADISSRLNEAFQTLTHDENRAEYLRLYNDARIGGNVNQVALFDEADKKFKMAMVLLKKKDFTKAREYLDYACKTVPNDGQYKAHLAWSLWTDPSLVNEAINDRVLGLLSEAVSLSPKDADAQFYYGSVLKMNGDIKSAVKHFKKCVEAKTNHTEAIRELRLLRSRSRK
jgi:hypothetical protein